MKNNLKGQLSRLMVIIFVITNIITIGTINNGVFATGVTTVSYDFNSALGTDWTAINGTWICDTTNGVAKQTSTGSGDPKRLVLNKSGYNISYSTTQMITAKIRVDNWVDGASARAGVGLLCDLSTGNGYNLLFNNDHSTVKFLNDGVAWGGSYTFNWSNNTWYWFKLKLESNVLSGKIWAEGTEEPSIWAYTQSIGSTSWNRASGNPGLLSCSYGEGGYATTSYDDVTISDPTNIMPTPTSTPNITPTNVALNKTATANSQTSTSESAQYAVDGSTTTKWCSINKDIDGNRWLKVDLGNTYDISRYIVKHAGVGGEGATYNTKDFLLQVSNDNTNWTTADTVVGNNANITDKLVTTSARYVRLYITNAENTGSNFATRIYEFEVYGVPSDSTTPTSPPVVTPTPNLNPTLNIGDYIQMGSYYGESILWRCVDIDENGPLMLSDRILTIKAFDAKGNHPPDTYYRLYYGSNFWEKSNIRSWLNSTASENNVNWLCGVPPTISNLTYHNAYASEKGFLANGNFLGSELNAIKPIAQKSLLNEVEKAIATNGNYYYYYADTSISNTLENYDTAYAHTVTDNIFLLDVKQVKKVYQNASILGASYYMGQPTQQAINNSTFKTGMAVGVNMSYWLRSPNGHSSYSDKVYCVKGDGSIDENSAVTSSIIGIRPAFYLDKQLVLFNSKTGTAQSPYAIKKEVIPPTISNPSLIASDITHTSITLNWLKANDNVTTQDNLQYSLYYSTSNIPADVASIENNATLFGTYTKDIAQKTVTGLTPLTTYYFAVIVMDGDENKSCYSIQTAQTVVAPPPEPKPNYTTTIIQNALYKQNGNIMGSLSVKISNNTHSSKALDVLLAVYNNDELINLTMQTVTLIDGDNTISFNNVNLANATGSNYTFKVFTWDSISNLQPLAEAVGGTIQ